jgi:hypothetical protein
VEAKITSVNLLRLEGIKEPSSTKSESALVEEHFLQL